MKKRSLTLLEVVIAIFLLGILLSGLFNTFRQGMKSNAQAKEIKQKILHLELFQQKLKNLFTYEEGVWIERHPETTGPALLTTFTQKADPDVEMCGKLQGMLYLTSKKELCLVVWSPKGKARVETLLDQVDAFTCQLFDSKKAEWSAAWPKKREGVPSMLSIDLTWKGDKIPFVFFLKDAQEKITYKGET